MATPAQAVANRQNAARGGQIRADRLLARMLATHREDMAEKVTKVHGLAQTALPSAAG